MYRCRKYELRNIDFTRKPSKNLPLKGNVFDFAPGRVDFEVPEDCGLFVKGEHKKQLAYEAHTACDVHGVVLAVEVTPGNVHDSVAFYDEYDHVVEQFPDVHAFVADSAYKKPHICKKVFGDNRVLSTAYKRPMTMKGGRAWWNYVYDEHFDCIICL